MKMTADVKKALEIAQNMDPEQRTLRPEWAAGALVPARWQFLQM